jgi:hypothetical protein
MNELARLHMEAERFEDAKALADVAVRMNSSEPEFAITLEDIRTSMEQQ